MRVFPLLSYGHKSTTFVKKTDNMSDDVTPHVMMPGSNRPDCYICGKPKSAKPWYIPIHAGTVDSFAKKTDGSIAKLDKRTVCGTGQGSAIVYVFPIDTCDSNQCIDTAYSDFQQSHMTPGCAWQTSLHQCAKCAQSPASLLFCGRCKAVRYCSRECQKQDWSRHKQNCHKNAK